MNSIVSEKYKDEIIVNANSLKHLTYSNFLNSLQVSRENLMPGVENRFDLLKKLGMKLQ